VIGWREIKKGAKGKIRIGHGQKIVVGAPFFLGRRRSLITSTNSSFLILFMGGTMSNTG
jgi:hypothetical protein